MEDGKNRSIPCGIEEFVGMPTGRKRSGFRFAVADNTAGQQVRIVKDRAISMRQRVTKFSPLVNGTWGLRRIMAGDAARERKLLEELAHAVFV